MKAVAAFLLVLSYLSFSHGWTCTDGPQLLNASQIDAGQGQVVLRDESSSAYYLIESSWQRLGSVPLKHVSVGAAGIWGVDSSNKVYKYVAGYFISSNGLSLKQVDAGGLGEVVGVTNSDTVHCSKSSIASLYMKVGNLSWNTLPGLLKYVSCSPLNGCWGVNSVGDIFVTTISPTNCGISKWMLLAGNAKMVEVGNDRSVFVVNSIGDVFKRSGISRQVPQGTKWDRIPLNVSAKHVSYDLGRLWVVGEHGFILQCVP